jgi:hypothetical protein
VDKFDSTGTVFYWQSQKRTTPSSARGRELINHLQNGVSVHLFVRQHKMSVNGESAPFRYYGPVKYLRHTGSAPMNFEWAIAE